jgi:hypothetical protein
MSIIIFIKNFQLYWIDVANKTDKKIDHKYMDKTFVAVSGSYAVDDNHSIYKFTMTNILVCLLLSTKIPSKFTASIIVNGADVTSLKLLHNHIFYSDISDAAYTIIDSKIIKLNNINYNDVTNTKKFFADTYKQQYILVSLISNGTIYIELNDVHGQYIETLYQDKIQDFDFSEKYFYVVKNNIIYRQLISTLVGDPGISSGHICICIRICI